MEHVYAIAAIWLALAVLATMLASHLRMSMALVEICVGMAAAVVADRFFHPNALGADLDWLRFVASIGAVLLTFLAGAELDPDAMKAKFREVMVVGLFGFIAPFLGCAALARFVLGWDPSASWLAGIALSTTSMAVVYAVMLESGFNKTEFGKGILGAASSTIWARSLPWGLCLPRSPTKLRFLSESAPPFCYCCLLLRHA